MAQVRITVEYRNDVDAPPTMRWEHAGNNGGVAFELLGRAFEVAQWEEAQSLSDALAAFCKGALLQKQDVIDALERTDLPA